MKIIRNLFKTKILLEDFAPHYPKVELYWRSPTIENIIMLSNGGMRLEFEWDYNKAKINLDKHGVSFDEAKTVFDDPFALIFDDPAHSFSELREIIIGYSLVTLLKIGCF